MKPQDELILLRHQVEYLRGVMRHIIDTPSNSVMRAQMALKQTGPEETQAFAALCANLDTA
jgi:hypothetical protein